MCSPDVYTNFNKYSKVFLKDLIATYPDTKAFKIMLVTLNTLKKVKKSLPHTLLNKFMFKDYGDKIMARDEKFFASDAFQFSIWPECTDTLKELLRTCDEHNKQAIWNHLNGMLALHKKCLSCPDGSEESESP